MKSKQRLESIGQICWILYASSDKKFHQLLYLLLMLNKLEKINQQSIF